MSDGTNGLDAARALLCGVALRAVGRLRGGERASVVRAEATWPDRPPDSASTTVIVKQFEQAGESWVRESAALSVLALGEASRLVAAGGEPPVVVTEDLGIGPGVADALLGADPAAATAAVHAWAQALARLHAAGRDLGAPFRAALDERRGDVEVDACRVPLELDDAVRIPDHVADEAFAAYRAVAADPFPEVAHERFARDVEAATAGWAPTSTTWFLGNALGSDPDLDTERPTPTRRAMITHRLGVAARTTELPALAELAGNLATELRHRWGDVPLAYAPAFVLGR